MDVTLFDRTLSLRDTYCSLNDNEPSQVDGPYINLYIQTTLTCNATCPFCVFRRKESTFDFKKFVEAVLEIKRNGVELRRVNITGGEPSLDLKLYSHIVDAIRLFEPDCFLGVNSNGSNLHGLFAASKDVDTVTISRHHENDAIHSSLMGIEMPTMEALGMYADKLHLSCNLMKDYVYDKKSVTKYLNKCLKYGIKDVGFVGLMKLNKFCEEHFIDFRSLFSGDLKSDNVLELKEWNNGDSCRCANYAYISDEHKSICQFYARHYCKANNNENTLVFNGQNLTVGFDNTNIVI